MTRANGLPLVGRMFPSAVPPKLSVTPLLAPVPSTMLSLPAVPSMTSICQAVLAGSVWIDTETGRMLTAAVATGLVKPPGSVAVRRMIGR